MYNICQIPQTLISFDRIDVHDDNPDLPWSGRIVEPSEGLEPLESIKFDVSLKIHG